MDLKVYGDTVPLAVFGVVALIAGFLVTFMPETSNTPLPDTIMVRLRFFYLLSFLTQIITYRMERTLGRGTASGLPAERENLSKLLKYNLCISYEDNSCI